MALPITSHVASVPPRPILALCHCAQRVSGVWYARTACLMCGGAGLRALAMEVRGG